MLRPLLWGWLRGHPSQHPPRVVLICSRGAGLPVSGLYHKDSCEPPSFLLLSLCQGDEPFRETSLAKPSSAGTAPPACSATCRQGSPHAGCSAAVTPSR